MTQASPDQRAEYIKGLRALADVLETHREVPLPWTGTSAPITVWFTQADDPRAALAAAVRAFPCDWRKETWESKEPVERSYLDLKGRLYGLRIDLTAYRDAVCERVVTGTREVTKKVKDPEKLAAVPEVEFTETVEEVEWRCHPLLAPVAAAGEPEPEGPVAA